MKAVILLFFQALKQAFDSFFHPNSLNSWIKLKPRLILPFFNKSLSNFL